MHRNGNIRKGIGRTVLVAALSSCLVLSAQAASRTVKGDGSGSWNFTDGTVTAETAVSAETAQTAAAQPASAAGPAAGQTVYEFDGKRYVIDSDWGSHYLTGFSPNADGSRKTRSGVDARANYTAASTLANLGKVILVQAESGPGDIHRYDGVYKCEDTGGPAVETGKENTGNTPVVDLFFDTAAEANYVSDAGWITARIYILREVE